MTNNQTFFSFQSGVDRPILGLCCASPQDNSTGNSVSHNQALGMIMSKKNMIYIPGNQVLLKRQWRRRRIFEFRRLQGPASITTLTCASIKVHRFLGFGMGWQLQPINTMYVVYISAGLYMSESQPARGTARKIPTAIVVNTFITHRNNQPSFPELESQSESYTVAM